MLDTHFPDEPKFSLPNSFNSLPPLNELPFHDVLSILIPSAQSYLNNEKFQHSEEQFQVESFYEFISFYESVCKV